MSYLVGNPEDRFPHEGAHISLSALLKSVLSQCAQDKLFIALIPVQQKPIPRRAVA